MNLEECRYEEHCEAQLCPMDKDVDNYVFYPEEQICKNPKYSSLRWVNRQRALRKHKRNTEIGFFNKKMLEVLGRVTHKTKGIDTRLKNQEKAIEEWMQRCLKKKSLRVQNAVFSSNSSATPNHINKS